MDRVPYVPERQQPGINQKKESPAQQQDQQGRSPDQVTEINDVLSSWFQGTGLKYLKIYIFPYFSGSILYAYQFLVIFSQLFNNVRSTKLIDL